MATPHTPRPQTALRPSRSSPPPSTPFATPSLFVRAPVSADEIEGQLLPARALGSSGIPSVVFAEDAPAFVHFVPTFAFQFTVHVPDELVQEAVQHLQKEIPSYHVTQERDYRLLDNDGVCALPRAVQLQWDASEEKELLHTPEEILIVPQSHFHFDVNDPTRSRGLIPPFDPSNSRILFPTMPAFLDAIIDTMFEPVDGVSHFYFKMSYLSCFLSYLVLYNVRDYDGCTDPATDELLPAAKALLEGVKAENLPFLETFMRTGSTRLTPPEVRAERERIKATRLAPPS
ncbi:hypothetical protein D9611_009773 [Ephemerocybe angulata]|uniref:Uncharacterized protein n=1 Tax=Ephemerocybe angulata TaxID=980116 RepID=A0A8H5FK80_9AGAR|nr:hypothetical protein D9611_009773 [Tulosesus angulatus]